MPTLHWIGKENSLEQELSLKEGFFFQPIMSSGFRKKTYKEKIISMNKTPVNKTLFNVAGNPAITINIEFLKTCPYKTLFSVKPFALAVMTYC